MGNPIRFKSTVSGVDHASVAFAEPVLDAVEGLVYTRKKNGAVVSIGVPPGGQSSNVVVRTASGSAWASGVQLDSAQVDLLQINVRPDQIVTSGAFAWEETEGTVQLGLFSGTSIPLGQKQMLLCRNDTGAPIQTGQALMFSGTLGASGRVKVKLMVADGSLPGYVFLGVAAAPIATGADGYVVTFGKIRGVNTNAFNEGDILWCNPAVPGGFTVTEPEAPNLKLAVAAVVSKANNGTLLVRADTGYRIDDLHNVQANGTKVDGDVLQWVAASGRWEPTDRLSDLEARVAAIEASL